MAKVFNSDQLNVKYVSKPGLRGNGGSLLTFARADGGFNPVRDTAMLIDTATIGFARALQRRFFLNTDGIGYVIGSGVGSLSVQGLLGKASDFATVFGVDLDNPCHNVLTATLNVNGMQECGTGEGVSSGIITMTGVIPQAINVTTAIDTNGTLYYNASASFEISGLSFD